MHFIHTTINRSKARILHNFPLMKRCALSSSRKTHLLALVMIFALLSIFIPLNVAHAESWTAWAAGGLADALASLCTMLNAFLFWLLQTLQGILDKVLGINFNDGLYRDTTAVRAGWKIVRDFTNMFFLLGFIVIGFATILRIESYRMQALLPKFVIGALLVNFSFILPIIVIDASNVFLHFFARVIVNQGILLSLVDASHLGTLSTISKETFIENATAAQVAGVNFGIQLFLTLFLLLFIYGIVALVGILVIRIVALWILIIVAPLAFLFMIFPLSTQWFSKWLSQLFQWSFLAPLMAFFLFLGAQIAFSLETMSNFRTSASEVAGSPSDFFSEPMNLLSYMVVLVFIYASVYFAQKSSAVGASLATSYTSRVLRAAGIAGIGGVATVTGIQALRRRIEQRREANKKVSEGAQKELATERAKLRYTGSLRQRFRERFSFTEAGRQAAQQKTAAMTEERAKYLAKNRSLTSVQQIAESRMKMGGRKADRAAAVLALTRAFPHGRLSKKQKDEAKKWSGPMRERAATERAFGSPSPLGQQDTRTEEERQRARDRIIQRAGIQGAVPRPTEAPTILTPSGAPAAPSVRYAEPAGKPAEGQRSFYRQMRPAPGSREELSPFYRGIRTSGGPGEDKKEEGEGKEEGSAGKKGGGGGKYQGSNLYQGRTYRARE